MLSQSSIESAKRAVNLVIGQQELAAARINLTPSENVLSPLARLPFLTDSYSRYFLDDLRLFGKWCFPSGMELGQIEEQVLVPLLKELAKARYVNVRALSGINCMTLALAGLTKPGDVIFIVPGSSGGHASTQTVAERLGLKIKFIPFANAHDLDVERLEAELAKWKPVLVYVDQASFLFPLDPAPIRKAIDALNLPTLIHYDSSHVSGLVLGGSLQNPLERGAHCFGGSTHKTLPGPHKGFLATNDGEIAKKIQAYSDHFVSHHQMASVLSLAITLLEMKECGGKEYAKNIIENAKILAQELCAEGLEVAMSERGYTECHQIWGYPKDSSKTREYADTLFKAGLVLNVFDGMPGIDVPTYRISPSEMTRRGAGPNEMRELASIIGACIRGASVDALSKSVRALKRKISVPRYCFGLEEIEKMNLRHEYAVICKALVEIENG